MARMRQAGLVVWQAHQAAAAMVEPGVSTAELDAVVEQTIHEAGAIPLFKGAESPEDGAPPFPASACISVNSEVVHGVPGSYRLAEGDVVSIDIGAKLDGWCGDAAVTHPVGQVSPETARLLEVTEGVLRLAIQLIGKKRRWRQVATEMERYIKNAGMVPVEDLVGARSMSSAGSAGTSTVTARTASARATWRPQAVTASSPSRPRGSRNTGS
jgi:methionyl aminopeptidase